MSPRRARRLTDILVEDDTGATGVQTGKLGEVVDERVDDDPHVAGRVVLLSATCL
jgi:hypothetical protein